MLHKPVTQFCCYDNKSGRVIIKLITDSNAHAVTVMYGDPFLYAKSKKKDKSGNYIWDWEYSEAVMEKQYSSDEQIMWRATILPPKVKRMKYAFIVSDGGVKEVYFGDNTTSLSKKEFLNQPFGFFFFPFIHDVDAPHVPAWAEDICWYQIFPERFFNGDPSISPPDTEDWETAKPTWHSFYGGDLRGIIKKLPYLQELGITGIYMTPVFLSPTNHKYNTQDYYQVDPHFGDKKTLKELVKKAHDLGMKVMLDVVFNHIGSKHKFWLDVLEKQENSMYKDYFHIHDFPVKSNYKTPRDINFDAFAYSANMPKWNTENPQARKFLIDVALYWIKELDIDGYRLDVSDEVSFDFWNDFRKAVKSCKENFYLCGEIWHDPTKWLGENCFDAVMNYPLGRVICDMFIYKKCDINTFNQKLAKTLMRFSDIHTRVMLNLLDSHDTTRLLTQAQGDKTALKNAFLFMFMMKGAPCIYYGTEIGMEGGHDPDCRRPMIWDAKKQDLELLDFFKRLIGVRKQLSQLIQNADVFYSKNKNICCWTLAHNNDKISIIYNVGKKAVSINEDVLIAAGSNEDNMLPAKTLMVTKGEFCYE